MRKAICLITLLLVFASLACPGFAAESFVPSISEKEAPALVPVEDGDGGAAIGVVREAAGTVVDYVYDYQMIVTPVSEAETSVMIPDEAEALLLAVYEQLSDGTMVLPYDEGVDPGEMVIHSLFDVSWVSEDLYATVAAEGTVVELTFDLGIDEFTDVSVMAYKNGTWISCVSVVNNGDGTITCVFEDFCPVAVSVHAGTARTADGPNVMIWVVILAVSAAALAAVLVSRRKAAR